MGYEYEGIAPAHCWGGIELEFDTSIQASLYNQHLYYGQSSPSSYTYWDLTIKRFKDKNRNIFYCTCEMKPKQQYLLDNLSSGVSSASNNTHDASDDDPFQIPVGFRPLNFDGTQSYKRFSGLAAYTWVASSTTKFVPALVFGTCDHASYQSSGAIPSSWSSAPFALVSYNGRYVRPTCYIESSGWYYPFQHWYSNITLEYNPYQCDYTG